MDPLPQIICILVSLFGVYAGSVVGLGSSVYVVLVGYWCGFGRGIWGEVGFSGWGAVKTWGYNGIFSQLGHLRAGSV
jgi:hypothetical protein